MCGDSLVKKHIDAEERLACASDCGYVHWNNPVPVVAGLVKIGNEYILARNSKWPEGFFSVITGFLEAGELPDAAIARETMEELGLTALSSTFIGHYPFPQMNQIIIGYVIEAIGEPVINDEIADIKRLSEKELVAYDFGVLKLTQAMVSAWQAVKEGKNIGVKSHCSSTSFRLA
jgi:NADH pyrophosphatase NudC (nudix superfamily)